MHANILFVPIRVDSRLKIHKYILNSKVFLDKMLGGGRDFRPSTLWPYVLPTYYPPSTTLYRYSRILGKELH
jgi:hypothetical protein